MPSLTVLSWHKMKVKIYLNIKVRVKKVNTQNSMNFTRYSCQSNHYIKAQNHYCFFLIFRVNEKSRQIAEKQITWRFGSSTVPPWQMVKSAPWVSDIFFLVLSFSWNNLSLNFWNSRNLVSPFTACFSVCEMWTVESAKFYAPYFAVFQHDFFPPAETWIYTQQMFYMTCVSKIAAF